MTTSSVFQAKNSENQPLIDALQELAEVETHSNVKNAGFRGRALRVAAQNLAKLDAKITDGNDLADSRSPNKVQGVGQGTAYYINEFLETGKLAEIDEIKANTKEQNNNGRQDPPGLVNDSSDDKEDLEETKGKKEEEKATNDEKNDNTKTKTRTKTDTIDTDQIHINRAPVLTLWVTVVAECQGYSHEEALTYGKWVSGMLAQAKGQALGIFQKKDKEATEEPKTKRQRTEKDHVEVFQHIQIPVQDVNGKQLAMEPKATDAIDPDKVQAYLERSFGTEDLQRAKEAMTELAQSISKNKLKDEAYEIYEIIRPEWHGWGKPGSLDLKKIRDLGQKAGEKDE